MDSSSCQSSKPLLYPYYGFYLYKPFNAMEFELDVHNATLWDILLTIQACLTIMSIWLLFKSFEKRLQYMF